MDMRALQQSKDGLGLGIFLLHPLSHKMPTRTVLSANKRDRVCRWLQMGSERNRHSGRGFVYSAIDANAQNITKGLEQKVLHQFVVKSHISSHQGRHFHLQMKWF